MQRKPLMIKPLIMAITLALSTSALASGFQIWEQSAAGTGDYHAGGAAEANDASTEFYNPAGLVRLKHPQVSLGGVGVWTHIPYDGTVSNDQIKTTIWQTNIFNVKAQGGGFNPIPNFYVASPVNDRFAVGFGVFVPFGSQTDYGNSTEIRYAATKTSLKTIDLSPALAIKITPNISIGLGIDRVYASGEFDQYAGQYYPLPSYPSITSKDTTSINKGNAWGTGLHGGLLLSLFSHTRIGISYHSSIKEKLTGTSKFTGELANLSTTPGGTQESKALNTTFRLPAYYTLSLFQDISSKWDVMASATYTLWSSFTDLKLNNVAGINKAGIEDNKLKVDIHENFHNTWNVALGAHYKLNTKWLIKAGIGFDQSPTPDSTRNVQLPDANRFALSTGATYYIGKNISINFGYTHIFMKNAPINQSQSVGAETITTAGDVKSHADIVGLQLSYTFM